MPSAFARPRARGLLQMTGVVVDILQKVERLPLPGEEVAALASRVGAGGGFNALSAAKRAGADVAYGGMLGQGVFAEVARAALAAEGVEALQTRAAEVDQGYCVVLVERGGERAYVYSPGAERTACAADLAALPVEAFAWVLLGGYAAPEAGEDVFGDWLAALPRKTLLMFDPTPLALRLAPARLAPALARADWVSANAVEARALTGLDPPRAAEALAQGRAGAIVRDGLSGCWLGLGGPAIRVAGFPVEAVDATGAGDTHNGAFIAARLAGKTPLEAARFANAAAALSVLRLGAATAPSLAETLGFLGARG